MAEGEAIEDSGMDAQEGDMKDLTTSQVVVSVDETQTVEGTHAETNGDMAETPEAQAEAVAAPTEGSDEQPVADLGEGEAAPEGAEPSSAAEGVESPEGDAEAATEAVEELDGEAEAAETVQAEESPAVEEALAAEAVPPEAGEPDVPSPPPYVPPEVDDDYIPVSQLPPIPPPYDVDLETGKKTPLVGVESVFLTGTTTEILGIAHLGSGKEGGKLMDYVSKEKILNDIQFRGDISDLYALKAQLIDSEMDLVLIRVNEEDIYGDQNNFEVALKQEAADRWNFIDEERIRRDKLLSDELLRTAIEKSKPRSQKKRVIKPWTSARAPGETEAEIDEVVVRPRRDPIKIILQKRRREFNQPFRLGDKDAHELWNSSQMECRPFKDPGFDLRRMEQDIGIQAIPETSETEVQATGTRPRPAAAQTAPMDMTEGEREERAGGRPLSRFLDRVMVQCEEALVQNEVTNIFKDDFGSLAEEDAAGGSVRKEGVFTESLQFTNITYSKNKVVTALQWLPGKKGVIAVACAEATTYSERVHRVGRPSNAYILIWNFRDPLTPEYVLQAPYEVFAFQFNPMNPDIVTAGCYNGQVVMWNLAGEQDKILASRAPGGGAKGSEASGDDSSIPVIRWQLASAIEFSHHHTITDLQWLPGIDLTRGKLTKLAGGAAEGALGKECSFFATSAGDGKVNFWDIRIDKLAKKGRKQDEDVNNLLWRPTHSIHLMSSLGMDLAGTRLCFNQGQLERGLFNVGSFDGELVHASCVKPEGEENSEYSRSCVLAHAGPVVSLERSPFFEDVLLTVGDWSFQIWREGESSTSPLFQSSYSPSGDYYTAGCWSPSRPSVVFLANSSGFVEVWDLLDRSHEPSLRAQLSSSSFMSMSFMAAPPGGQVGTLSSAISAATGGAGASASQPSASTAQLLAMGDATGLLRIIDLPRNLRRPVPNERKLMAIFLERETERVADMTSRGPHRSKAIKAAEEKKKAQEEAIEAAKRDAQVKDQSSATAVVSATIAQPGSKGGVVRSQQSMFLTSAVDEKAEAEYRKMEATFRKQLGLDGEVAAGEDL